MTTESRLSAIESSLAGMQTQLSVVEAESATAVEEINTFYLMWAGALIFLMQAGFAMLSAGSIRAKNVSNILLKNLLDACIGCVAWFLVGYGFAYDVDVCVGDACDAPGAHKASPFIGSGPTNFALSGVVDYGPNATSSGYDWITFFFQYTFAAAAATIVSGAVAERCQLVAYLVYSFCITGLVYPVVVHWVWDAAGFLSAANPDALLSGMIDFAGSGVVHMTGGWAALVGAKVLGPRTGRFEHPADFEGHSTPLQAIGTFLLWFGWYGFNPGSTLYIHGASRDMARAAVTTTLSGAVGGITGLFAKKFLPSRLGGSGYYEIGHTCNTLLGGLVGITAGCSVVRPWAAILIGFVSAHVYHAGSCLVKKLKIDDPLDAFAVHGSCGLWALIAVGLFAQQEYSFAPHPAHEERLNDDGTDKGADAGLFMPGSRGLLFGTQLVGAIIIILWVVSLSTLMFGSLKMLGMFRTPLDLEEIGADISKHGGSAYVYPTPEASGHTSPNSSKYKVADASSTRPPVVKVEPTEPTKALTP